MSDPEDKHLLLAAFVDELARCGMRHACTAPGSRNTPLLLALARESRLRCHSHIDERCAGFFALGLAKATGMPAAVAVTSGTAVAELLPAAIEAREARVPLLLLSADRPPELREVGAGQTIDQMKIFGSAAKWFFEVDLEGIGVGGEPWVRTLACRAFATTLEGRPGVVHLNFPLREPLVIPGPSVPALGSTDLPSLDTSASASDSGLPPAGAGTRAETGATRFTAATGRRPGASGGGRRHGMPYLDRRFAAPGSGPAVDALLQAVAEAGRGVLVAGREERPSQTTVDAARDRSCAAAAAFCAAHGFPLLADPLSGARRGIAAIAHYDALLRDDRFVAEMRPQLIVRIGDLPTSKPLRSWLAALSDVPQIALDPEGAWNDPASVVGQSFAADPASTLWTLAGEREKSPASDGEWLSRWRAADVRVSEAINATLARSGLSEPAVAAELGTLLPREATLFVASSMPVRDIETFWPAREDPPRALCNRGANGIDGTVSSAFGVAAGSDGPVVLLIGDVALAHDIGGLIAAQRLDLKLTIILLNNGGGGIFDFLPIASTPAAREPDASMPREDLYTRHVATPTGLDFTRAAALYGLRHERVEDVRAFREALERALAGDGSAIVEVRTERETNVRLHDELWTAVTRAIVSDAR